MSRQEYLAQLEAQERPPRVRLGPKKNAGLIGRVREVVEAHPGQTSAELAQALGVERSAVQRTLRRLRGGGVVRRNGLDQARNYTYWPPHKIVDKASILKSFHLAVLGDMGSIVGPQDLTFHGYTVSISVIRTGKVLFKSHVPTHSLATADAFGRAVANQLADLWLEAVT